MKEVVVLRNKRLKQSDKIWIKVLYKMNDLRTNTIKKKHHSTTNVNLTTSNPKSPKNKKKLSKPKMMAVTLPSVTKMLSIQPVQPTLTFSKTQTLTTGLITKQHHFSRSRLKHLAALIPDRIRI